jgi:radical SAM superfamily enzyme YgiQ (UPF0313 family)
MHCLLVYPEFAAASFWNYRATCDLMGAKYPAAPLGLITVAALLPESWDCRLVDCNVEPLRDEDVAWADLVLVGAMIAQQVSARALIERLKAQGKTVVAGGPDVTSSPHVYDAVDYLVLGEAEITLPRWVADFQAGCAEHIYPCGDEKADMALSPVPRFDLLTLGAYLHVGVQGTRGCPYNCEFCDIIELYGRVPRLKPADRILEELDVLYATGYRGHVDFVDDNFIGNRREVKKLLPQLLRWQADHQWPFEFSTEVSINVADDEELLGMMRDAGFFAVFVGLETPDTETLDAVRKRQNLRGSLAERVRKLYAYGIFVNSGYIVGFDTEPDDVAERMLALIDATLVPANMVGLLFALPGTQLTRRLEEEGRLGRTFDVAPVGHGDQCLGGLNFETRRPRAAVLADYRRILAESYAPKAYFSRVRRMGLLLNCRGRKLCLPLGERLREMRGFLRLAWRMGVKKHYRLSFWGTLVTLLLRNPAGVRRTVGLMALYLHFGDFVNWVVDQIGAEIRRATVGPEPPRELRRAV